MKYYLFALIALIACTPQQEGTTDTLVPNDTITTASGLQYYYIKKGDGRLIEDGCKVSAYNRLYLNDVDTVFWSTDTSEDSVFNFIQGVTPLIDGALELYPKLREGDKVVAIMPDSIAYGKEDRNGLPGGSTLIFNPIIIKTVSEPKDVLSDTLLVVFENGTVDDLMNVYESIANSSLADNYHMDEKGDIYSGVLATERYEELEEIALRFEALVEGKDEKKGAWFYHYRAIMAQGDTARAISRLKEIIDLDPEETYWKTTLKQLEDPS